MSRPVCCYGTETELDEVETELDDVDSDDSLLFELDDTDVLLTDSLDETLLFESELIESELDEYEDVFPLYILISISFLRMYPLTSYVPTPSSSPSLTSWNTTESQLIHRSFEDRPQVSPHWRTRFPDVPESSFT